MTFVSSLCKNLTLTFLLLPPSPQCGTVAVLELPVSPSASWSHWCWSRQPSWPAEPLPPQGSQCASLEYVSAVPRLGERGCRQIRYIKKQYLGVQILPVIECVVKTNYDYITKAVNESVERWMSLPISILGRVNVLKMNILPKLLYVFQNIPLPPPPGLFTWIKKILVGFFVEQ